MPWAGLPSIVRSKYLLLRAGDQRYGLKEVLKFGYNFELAKMPNGLNK